MFESSVPILAPVQLDELASQIIASGQHDGARAELLRELQALRRQVDRDDVIDAPLPEPDDGAETDRADAEDDDLVSSGRVGPVHRVQRDS